MRTENEIVFIVFLHQDMKQVEQGVMEPDDRRLKIKERITKIFQHIPEDVLERLLEAWLWEINELLKKDSELLKYIQAQLEEDTDMKDKTQ